MPQTQGGRFLAVDGDQDLARHNPAQKHRERGEEEADIVDAERVERQEFPDQDLVGLAEDKAADGGEKDPFAEVDQFLRSRSLPTEAVARARQENGV